MHQTRISIVTATYNCVDTIAECFESVDSQTYLEYEHIVIDGVSHDGTLGIIEKCGHRLAALRSEPDCGIYDALNKGIILSTGDVVGFLHGDDVFGDSETLTRVAGHFDDPAVCAVYGDLQYVRRDDVNAVVRRWRACPPSRRRLAWGWMPPHPTLYVRRNWYERIGGFDTRYRIAADYHSVLKLFSQPDFKAVYLPHVLVKMRLGGTSNRSLGNIFRKSWEDYDALKRTEVGGVGALLWKNVSKIGQFV